jgi:hypothetical protein
MKIVICKWIFKKKRVVYGYITKYNSLLVSKGFSQVQGIDYENNFAPVAKIYSIQLALAIATARKWEVHHMYVNNELFHRFINEYIYMEHP